ncbi:MAG: glycoside hydrolase family 13 protein, partial [Clostridia bacterium]|nr:glycoside hydrolase family 13 protein [Clostridia bacterium]
DCWWGVDILPEIDEENDSYIAYISKVLKKWQKAGASGWRLDVADELPDKFLDALRQTVKAENENALILGEVWEDASIKISYGQRRRYLQGRQLDSVMNYPFANALADFAVTGIAEGFNDKILEITENYPKCAVDCLMNHIGTHDTCRILNRLGTLDSYESDPINRYTGEMTKEERDRGRKLLKMVSAMQFTLPGVPCIYYGDEVGTEGGVDPFNRGCYPYGAEDEEMLEHYRMLGRIRKEHPVFIDGSFSSVSCVMGCVAYERRGRGERIITVANRNPCTISYYLPDSGFVSLTGQRVNGKELLLEADSAAILYMRCD